MVDRERAAQYLDALDRILRDWREISLRATLKSLRADRALLQRGCYVMLIAVQTALDLANLIIAARSLPRPDSYRAAFRVLKSEGVLRNEEVCGKLEELAGLRNLLVHAYVRLNLRKTQRNLKSGLPVLLSYRKDISRLLRRS